MAKHIEVHNSANCSGCRACSEICPKHCIEMRPDRFGLIYPNVNTTQCIECGQCVKVCPFINEGVLVESKQNFAAINIEEKELRRSSSGGVFIRLAENIIQNGGVVFGAVFDSDWTVYHRSALTMEDVLPMMQSKYLQSNTRATYSEAKHWLDEGKPVMYTGTPCQIAGLRRYLRKEYEKLLLVEVICHGVPAPEVWKKYLSERLDRLEVGQAEKNTVLTPPIDKTSVVADINFRSKRESWKKFGFDLLLDSTCGVKKNSVLTSIESNKYLYSEPFTQNEYMLAFLRDWSLRPSCYACKVKSGKSGADLTIGDFWGVEHVESISDDDTGISCIVCRTQKGINAITSAKSLLLTPVTYSSIFKGNSSLERSVREPEEAARFKKLFIQYGFFRAFHKVESPSILYRGVKLIKRHLHLN